MNGSIVVGNKARVECKRGCICLPENIRPGVLNWDQDQVPRNGWRKRNVDLSVDDTQSVEDDILTIDEAGIGDDVPSSESLIESGETTTENLSNTFRHIFKKQISHDWAIACEMDGKRHEIMTEASITLAPRYM